MLPFIANENLKGRGRYLLGEKQVDSSELVLHLAGSERRRPGLVFPSGTSAEVEVVKLPRWERKMLVCWSSQKAPVPQGQPQQEGELAALRWGCQPAVLPRGTRPGMTMALKGVLWHHPSVCMCNSQVCCPGPCPGSLNATAGKEPLQRRGPVRARTQSSKAHFIDPLLSEPVQTSPDQYWPRPFLTVPKQ